MLFNLAACPAGWAELVLARGRYFVGLPPGGNLALQVGTALANGENRPTGVHSHAVIDPGHSHTTFIGVGASPRPGPDQVLNAVNPTGGLRPYDSDTRATGISIAPAGVGAGTNAPYLQLLACQKN